MNQHTPEPFAPVIIGLVVMIVGPALIPDEIMTTVIATSLWQARPAILGGVLLTMFAFWIVSRVRVQGSSVVEGGEN